MQFLQGIKMHVFALVSMPSPASKCIGETSPTAHNNFNSNKYSNVLD